MMEDDIVAVPDSELGCLRELLQAEQQLRLQEQKELEEMADVVGLLQRLTKSLKEQCRCGAYQCNTELGEANSCMNDAASQPLRCPSTGAEAATEEDATLLVEEAQACADEEKEDEAMATDQEP